MTFPVRSLRPTLAPVKHIPHHAGLAECQLHRLVVWGGGPEDNRQLGPKRRHLDSAESLAILDFAHRFFSAKRLNVPLEHHVDGRDFRRLFRP